MGAAAPATQPRSTVNYDNRAAAAGLDATQRAGGGMAQVSPHAFDSMLDSSVPHTMGAGFSPQGLVPKSSDAQTTPGQDSAGSLAGGNQQALGLNPWQSLLPQTYDPNAIEGAQSERESETAGTDDRMNEIRDMWADILAGQQAGLQDTMYGIDADEARNARRAANINAEMGGSVGGGFQGGQIQAQLGGTVARSQARAAADKQALTMKMSFLDNMMQMAEAENNRELQEWLQSQQDQTAIDIATLETDTMTDIATAGLHTGEDDGGPSGPTPESGDIVDKDALEIGDPDHPNYQDWDAYDTAGWLEQLANEHPTGEGNGLTKYDQATFDNWWLTTSQSLGDAGYSGDDLLDLQRASLQYMSKNNGKTPTVQELIDWFNAGK
jgi:hypothetical protein